MDDKKTAMTKAVTSLFYKGLTVAQIAEELHISKRTVISRKNDAKKSDGFRSEENSLRSHSAGLPDTKKCN